MVSVIWKQSMNWRTHKTTANILARSSWLASASRLPRKARVLSGHLYRVGHLSWPACQRLVGRTPSCVKVLISFAYSGHSSPPLFGFICSSPYSSPSWSFSRVLNFFCRVIPTGSHRRTHWGHPTWHGISRPYFRWFPSTFSCFEEHSQRKSSFPRRFTMPVARGYFVWSAYCRLCRLHCITAFFALSALLQLELCESCDVFKNCRPGLSRYSCVSWRPSKTLLQKSSFASNSHPPVHSYHPHSYLSSPSSTHLVPSIYIIFGIVARYITSYLGKITTYYHFIFRN